jgi:hypothetical protein
VMNSQRRRHGLAPWQQRHGSCEEVLSGIERTRTASRYIFDWKLPDRSRTTNSEHVETRPENSAPARVSLFAFEAFQVAGMSDRKIRTN